MTANVDPQILTKKVKQMYQAVAENPFGEFHFEMGRALAERLGYDPTVLDTVPAPAIDSFAGVGHHFRLAKLQPGERVLDLGSGSGMDTFVAARYVGPTGSVVGIDMTDAQRNKAESLRQAANATNIKYDAGTIEALPYYDESFDVVISNGVINLSAEKSRVFSEAARVLRPGGRLAISDIVTDVDLPEPVVCNAGLWAACIGGALERERYQSLIEAAGMTVRLVQVNKQYGFLSNSAQGAVDKWGVKSISLVAVKS